MEARSSWHVAQTSILALITRNIQKRFITNVQTNRAISFLWIFLEPMMHVAVWTGLRWLQGTHDINSIPLPLFVLLGAVPWLFTRYIIIGSIKIISSEKGLFIFKQIRPVDLIIARILSELAVMMMVFFILLLSMTWFGVQWEIHNIAFWLINIVSYILFVAGAGLLVAVLGFFFRFVKVVLTVCMRTLYMISGIFFSAQMIPLALRKFFLLNPVFQIVEISRECFSSYIVHDQLVNPIYLFKCAIVSLLLGMAAYISTRNRIMTEIAQR